MTKEMKSMEKSEELKDSVSVEFTNNVNVPVEIRENIVKKAKELKEKFALRKVFLKVMMTMINLCISHICAAHLWHTLAST